MWFFARAPVHVHQKLSTPAESLTCFQRLDLVLWLLCAFEMNFIILLAQSLTQSSLCRLVLEASTRDYVVSSYIMTILAQQWLMYLVICGGDQTPNTVFENSLKIYWMRYSEWVLRNNNLEIQKCEGIIFVHSNLK